MKRVRKTIISGIVALSLILAGTGYAYWTDTLNVTTKATTGDFDVTFVDLGLYAQYQNETLPSGWSIVDGVGENGYVDDNFFMRGTSNYNSIAKAGSIDSYKEAAKGYNSVDFNATLSDNANLKKAVGPYGTATKSSDNIELTVSNMYPGYAQAFRTDIVNQGSIAAKLSTLKFSINNLGDKPLTDTTKDMLGIAVLMDKDDNSGSVFKLCTAFAAGDNYFTVGGVDFLRLSALQGLSQDEIKEVITNAELQCSPKYDGRMDLLLAVAMDPDAEGVYTTGSTDLENYQEDAAKDGESQNNGAIISIDFGWDQFNAGVTVNNPNILKKQNVSGN